MDIHALLSPNDSPARDTSSPEAGSPRKSRQPAGAAASRGKRPASAISNAGIRHPDERFASTPSSQQTSSYSSPTRAQFPYPQHSSIIAAVPNFRPLHQAPTSNPSVLLSPTRHGDGRNYQSYMRPVVAHRPSSTPQMETLAGTWMLSLNIDQKSFY